MTKFTFYYTIARSDVRSYMPNVPSLFPASSYFRDRRFRVPRIPAHVIDRAGDCGGFVFQKMGMGYPFTIRALSQWYSEIGVNWGAMLDYPCERELGVVTRLRQIQTTLSVQHIWNTYRSVPFVWVPTIQGLTLTDYQLHAKELSPIIHDMQAFYGNHSGFRVGIGSLCQRTKTAEIQSIVSSVAREIPGIPLHLWGVKLGVFKSIYALHTQVISTDSAAWNGLFGKAITEQRNARHALGLSKMQYCYQIMLPAYQQKVSEALTQPKQLDLEV